MIVFSTDTVVVVLIEQSAIVSFTDIFYSDKVIFLRDWRQPSRAAELQGTGPQAT